MSPQLGPSFCTPRIDAIDLGRGFSVLVMIAVHCLWVYGDIDTQEHSWLGLTLHGLGKGTAVFLLAMGLSFMLAREHSLAATMRRGVYLLLLGYVTNALNLIPVALGVTPDSLMIEYGWHGTLTWQHFMTLVVTGDVLQLAGLSLFVLGPLRRVVHDSRWFLVLAVVVACASHPLRGTHFGWAGLDAVADLLWGVELNVYFPLFPWLACVLVGMYLGGWFREAERTQAQLFGRMLPLGLVFFAVGSGLLLVDYEVHFRDFFHLGAGGIFYLVGIALLSYWLLFRFGLPYIPAPFARLLRYCSRRVTTLYVLQWSLICWAMGVFGYHSLGPVGVLFTIGVLLVSTLVVQRALDFALRPKRSIDATA